ncbi:MBL fold metallo-hydrolase [bacterium]|nr:MBL fold metallo-hydrolase [bacterium]
MFTDRIIPIVPGIDLLVGGNNGRLPFSHSFLVRGDFVAVIDTGCGEDLLKYVRARFAPDLVINTHSHLDHCSRNGIFTGTRLSVPHPHHQTVGDLKALAERFIGDTGLREEWVHTIVDFTGFSPLPPTETYNDGDVFDFGAVRLRAVHLPGHLDDHFGFVEETSGVVICTDVDLTAFGPWYGNPESNIEQFEASIERVRRLSPSILAPSHRFPLREGIDQALAAYEKRLRDNEEKVFRALIEPKTLDELCERKPFYRIHPSRKSLLRYFEGVMIGKHLERLVAAGRAVERDGRFVQAVRES